MDTGPNFGMTENTLLIKRIYNWKTVKRHKHLMIVKQFNMMKGRFNKTESTI